MDINRTSSAEYSGPKPPQCPQCSHANDLHHPPVLQASKSLTLSSKPTFFRGADEEYCTKTLRRTKSASQITKPEQVLVLDQPDKWFIYRIPSKLRKVNEAAYTPQILSIGPFHYGKPELKDMETHKNIYYKNFRARCRKSEDQLKCFIKDHLQSILHSYAGTIELGKDLADIIVVDACFIIELFVMNSSETENQDNDYILRSPWLRKAVKQDLILFENQLPYALLQELYNFAFRPPTFHPEKQVQVQEQAHTRSSTNHDLRCCFPCFSCCFPSSCETHSMDHSIEIDKSKHAPDHPFLKLSCEFFKDYNKAKSVKTGVKPKHFTDLVRNFVCPDEEELTWTHNSTHFRNIYPVRKLRASGVKFSPLEDGHFVVKRGEDAKCKVNLACFRNMDLKLAKFCVEDETECVIRNIMALEQFVYPDKPYICNYFLLLDQLVDTVEDVDMLVENKVILNMLGSNEAVAKLVNRLCEQIMEDKSCYVDICERLNRHYENFWNRHVATLKRVYFKDLWTGSSTVLGIFVLAFSITGTIVSLKS